MRIATLGIMAVALLAAACSSSPMQRSQTGTAGSTTTSSGMAGTIAPTAGSGDVIDQFAAQVDMQRRSMR